MAAVGICGSVDLHLVHRCRWCQPLSALLLMSSSSSEFNRHRLNRHLSIRKSSTAPAEPMPPPTSSSSAAPSQDSSSTTSSSPRPPDHFLRLVASFVFTATRSCNSVCNSLIDSIHLPLLLMLTRVLITCSGLSLSAY
jgi:hypothetical protein